jgi:transposase
MSAKSSPSVAVRSNVSSGLKEALHSFYRIRGRDRADIALTKLTDQMALSTLPEIATLRRTLIKWRTEIRTEGFNNKAKVVKRRAYGYRSFENYRLRLLSACA